MESNSGQTYIGPTLRNDVRGDAQVDTTFRNKARSIAGCQAQFETRLEGRVSGPDSDDRRVPAPGGQ
jgi:hypothetical protein